MLGRVDKLLSLQLNMSRSDVKLAIKAGRVVLNGRVITKPDIKIDTDQDAIFIDNAPISFLDKVYLMMNKPKGVICASNDKKAKTVIDIIPNTLARRGLFTVGRLDKDTTGLLIITDDGDFSHKVISPKSHITKKYEVEVDGIITNEMITIFKDGVILADKTKCMPAKLKKLSDCVAEVDIFEGKYHQVKRMFGVVGLGVNKLRRISIGGLVLDSNLKLGECRKLTEKELCSIFNEIAE